jgi:hypothetical protein
VKTDRPFRSKQGKWSKLNLFEYVRHGVYGALGTIGIIIVVGRLSSTVCLHLVMIVRRRDSARMWRPTVEESLQHEPDMPTTALFSGEYNCIIFISLDHGYYCTVQ